MNKCLILSFIAAFIQFSNGQTTDANCTAATTACLLLTNATLQVNETKCDQYNASFQCLKNLTCVSDVYLRLAFLRGGDTVNSASCNLTNDVYPPITTVGCPSKKRDCLFAYTDNLMALSKISNDSEGICLHLVNYVQCLLPSTCDNETQITAMVASEQARAKINSTEPCIIPSLLRRTLTFTECEAATMQCLSIAKFRPNGSDLCAKLQESFRCTASLNCDNDVMPLVSKAYYMTNMTQYLTTTLAKCDLDSMFPLNKANLTECERVRKNCTYPYVESVVTKSESADICKDLNTYITCLSKAPTCMNMDKLKQLSSDEMTRTTIKTCTLTVFSGGEGLAWGWMTMMAILLAYFILN